MTVTLGRLTLSIYDGDNPRFLTYHMPEWYCWKIGLLWVVWRR